MTVGELRKALKDVPDDYEISATDYDIYLNQEVDFFVDRKGKVVYYVYVDPTSKKRRVATGAKSWLDWLEPIT